MILKAENMKCISPDSYQEQNAFPGCINFA